jgi:hypothetical protein
MRVTVSFRHAANTLAWLRLLTAYAEGFTEWKKLFLLLNISEGKRKEESRNGIFQEAEILEESKKFQNGSCERYFEVPRAMHKAKIKEPITGEQQQYSGKLSPGKQQGDYTPLDRRSI